MKKVPFKPRNMDEDIKRRSAAIRLEKCDVEMRNIFVSNSDVGISMSSDTNLKLDNYYAYRTRKPIEIRDK